MTGIITGAAASTSSVYFRTDVGGAYRLNANSSAWIPLNDGFPYSKRNLYGVSSLAVSSSNPLRVFAAFGGYLDQEPSGIFGSTDGGDNWSQLTPATWPVAIGGNDYTHTSRATGERLAVHPADDSILLFGSELSGLWRSADGGGTWANVACSYLPCTNTSDAEFGVSFVTFDPAHPDIVLALLYNVSMFVSTDAGQTFVPMAGSPGDIARCAWAIGSPAQPGDTFTPLWCSSRSGLWSMSGRGAWARAGPAYAGVEFIALAVNPWSKGQEILAIPYREGGPAVELVYSSDGGVSFTSLPSPISNQTLPWDTEHITDLSKGSATANVAWDPQASVQGRVWLGNWYSMWYTDTLTAPGGSVWTNVMPGHEEVFVLSATMPAAGPLLIMGTADLGGFQFPAGTLHGLSDYAPVSYSVIDGGEGTGSDATELTTLIPCNGEQQPSSLPSGMVRTQYVPWKPIGQQGVVAWSCNGGDSWQQAAGWNGSLTPLRVAIAAYDMNAMVVLTQGGQAMVTGDAGFTWAAVDTLPTFDYTPLSGNRYNMSSPLTADKTVQPKPAPSPAGTSVFWYFACEQGMLYRSVDGGRSFQRVAVAPGSASPGPTSRCQLLSYPVLATSSVSGTLLLAAGKGGYWAGQVGINGQIAWEQAPEVLDAHAIAVGAAPPTSPYPVIYLYGQVMGGESQDYAPYAATATSQTWVPLGNMEQGLGDWTEVMSASRQLFGVLMLGSFGRGAFWANASALLAPILAAQ